MKVIHTVSTIGKESYGLGSISVGLAKAQLQKGLDVEIWSSDNQENLFWASQQHNFPIERLRGFEPNIPIINLSLKEYNLAKQIKKVEIVHQHSLWTGQSIISNLLRQNGAKTVIAAHGALSQFAIEKSENKKKIAKTLFEGTNLQNASVLHATSMLEIDDFRNYNLQNSIAYIENGIAEEILHQKGNGEIFRKVHKIPVGKKILLYLSRITPKKGLSMLLKAIGEIKDDFSDWILIIAGNNEFGYQIEVENMIVEYSLQNSVKILPPQIGEKKFDAFDASKFLILPSYSEGSPMVVLDSLAYGLPVITTQSSTWNDLYDYKCGFWTEISKESIKNALLKMVKMSDQELINYSKNAKDLIKKKYLWEEISQKTLRLYNWILKGIDKPEFIF